MADIISGVTRVDGALAQARVTLVNADTNTVVSSQLSNVSTGAWSFVGLPAGTYEVVIFKDGYKAVCEGPWTLDGLAGQYMRLRITANNGDTYFGLQELEIRQSVGGADITTPATPITATSVLSTFVASEMVDNSVVDSQQSWTSLASPGSVDIVITLGVDFNTIAEIALMPLNHAVGPGRAPKDFTIAAGASSSGPWSVRKTVVGSTGWTAGVYRAFTVP